LCERFDAALAVDRRVRSSNPVIACLASQYAGWRLTHGEGKDAFFRARSGPARALARKEPVFADIAYRDKATAATLVLESGHPPPARGRDQGRRGLRASSPRN